MSKDNYTFINSSYYHSFYMHLLYITLFFIFRSCHEKELLIDGQKPPQIDTVVVTNGKNGTTKREMVGSESKEEIV